MRSSTLIIALALLVVCASPAEAQDNTVRVVVDQDRLHSTVIGVFRTRGILYASLTDLAQTFQLTSYENVAAAKMELKQGPYRIKVTGGSPFIVVTDQAQRQTVYQLPVNVMFAAGSFFVPLQSFLPYFSLVFNKTATFDPGANVLRVGTVSPVSAFDIPTVFLEPKTNGMLIRIPSSKRIEDVESWLRQDGWLYVTLVDVKADVKTINAIKETGIVKDVVAIQSPTSVQLTFKLAGKIAASEILREDGSQDILVSIRTPDAAESKPVEPVSAAPAEEAPSRSVDRTVTPGVFPDLSERKKRWDLDVIVIDPGHGGHDPGTIGVSGVYEKDIALAIALKLGALIKKDLPDVRVVYTRSKDVFVPLYRRGQIANEAGGKLVLSIHCNSTKRKPSPTRGMEIYLLRPGRTEEAIAIAEKENAVITLEEGYEDRYKELTDENFILVTMAQSAYVKSSEVLADLVHKEVKKMQGLSSRGVMQAGFFVLVGAAMPNILVETGFVSNRSEEKFLKSSAGQRKIANAIFQAIKRYKAEYEKLLTGE
ncbi:MAG: N-acetylmuramoyl-L-alanine amidase [Bacteroidetes bacterium]|nr:N-acetylmuramoyl-L-alanine amidase [Bacteroidota bacterium]